jgi:microcystin degradation protein MlrC
VPVTRVGIVSFMHESNTFNRVPTGRDMFEVRRGADVVHEWRASHHEVGGMLARAEDLGLEVVPLLTAYAEPLGPVVAAAYEALVAEMVERLTAASLDGLLLSLHGAMVAEHVRDADGETAARIRRALGPEVPVVLTLDLHANVSERMIDNVTATTIYRTNPHLDQRARGAEAVEILARTLTGEIRPRQALEKPPQVIGILAQETAAEPLAGLYARLESLARRPGMVSASFALGYPYADVEEMGPAIVVVADGDANAARSGARGLASAVWEARASLGRAGMPVDEAVAAAASGATPVTILDVGDNVGGGSPGDGTVVLEALLRSGVRGGLVILYDPPAVRRCVEAGVGQAVALDVGGRTDDSHGRPVAIRGKVRLVHDGLFTEESPRHGGKFYNNQGLTAVVETADEHTLVLNSAHITPFSLEQLHSLGIQPARKRVLVAKGAIAPRAAYAPISARVIEADTPGITAANPERFEYRHRLRPMFPFERHASYPSLEPPGSAAGGRRP